jgi:hypothetical protein
MKHRISHINLDKQTSNLLNRYDTLKGWLSKSVTTVGWLCIACCLLSLVFALALGWTGFASVAVISLFMLIVAVPFVIGKQNYEVRFDIQFDRVVAGDDVPGKIIVKNVGKGISFGSRVEIPMIEESGQFTGTTAILHIPLLRPGKEHSEEFMLPTRRRAVFNVGPVLDVKTDPIHLLRIEHEYGTPNKLFVHPQTISIPSSQVGMIRDIDGDPTDKITVSDISFRDIRDYVPGDPVKNINWKATAKLDKLMVRQFEESRRAKIVFALSTNDRDYSRDNEFELAISAMASLGFRAAADNRDIEIVTSGTPPLYERHPNLDIVIHPNRSPRGVLDAFSGVNKSYRDLDLTEVCEKIANQVHDISLVVIGVGSGRTLDNIQKAALHLPQDCDLIVIQANPYQPPSIKKLGDITFISLAVLDDLKQFIHRKAM